MDPLAQLQDVTDDWGEVDAEDKMRIPRWIQQLSTRIRLIGRERGIDVDELIARDALAQEGAKDAIVAAIRRRLMNPEGYRSISKSANASPFGTTDYRMFDPSIAGADLVLTDDDMAWLPTEAKAPILFGRIRIGSGYYR